MSRGLRWDFGDDDTAVSGVRQVFTHHKPLTCAMAGERIAELEADLEGSRYEVRAQQRRVWMGIVAAFCGGLIGAIVALT